MLSQPLLPLGNGRYDLREILGAGGMATVYRAYDQRLQCERAIKVLAPALSERTSIRNRFIAEARTMARLQHPNIVHVDEVVYDEGPVYMVMEMVRRGSLIDILKHHGPMPPKLASAVLQPVLAALTVAHAAGIIHRDIKPHNILLTETGIPKLTDFGIAQIRGGTSTANTRTNTMMGTLAYMAPEQRSSARRVDARSDVYSVGATLYTLVTRKEPHDIFAQEIQVELLAGVNEDLATFIRHATRYKPEERYQSAREMLAALRLLHPRLPDVAVSWAGIDEAAVGGGASGFSEPSLLPMGASLYPPMAPASPPAAIDAGLTMNLTGIGGMTIPSSAATKYVTGHSSELLRLDAHHTGFDPMDEHRTPFTILPREAGSVDEPTTERPPVASTPPARAPEHRRTAVVSGVVSAVLAACVVVVALSLRDEPVAPAAAPPAVPVIVPPPSVVAPAVLEVAPVEPAPPEAAPARATPEPAPQPAPAPTPAAVDAGVPTGTLGINSIPWSRVAIDGTDRGTSGKRFAVDPGPHEVVLTTETGIATRVTLDVAAGGTRIYCWDFAKGTECLR
jgi:tRNA A-37 threonylcarbamoyl transferase component Bud32